MCGVQGVRNLDRQVQQPLEFQWSALDVVLERLSLKQFHGDERLPAMLVDVINRADVGVKGGEADCPSRWKRSRATRSFDSRSGKNLSATKRWSLVSSAL